MTMTEARKILGVAASASRTKIEQAYHRKLREQRLRQMPGNTLQHRQQAYRESVRVNEAWNILSQINTKQSQQTNKPNTPNTTARPSRSSQSKPKNMADAGDSLVQLLPFSEKTTTIVTVVVVVIFIIMVLSFLF